MFSIVQNLKHVHMTYIFWTFDLFSLSLVDIYWLAFIFHCMREILYVNTNSKENQSWNNHEIKIKRYTFWLVSDIDAEKLFFTFFSWIFNFSEFHEHILHQPFHKCVNLNKFSKKYPYYYVLKMFSSQNILDTYDV